MDSVKALEEKIVEAINTSELPAELIKLVLQNKLLEIEVLLLKNEIVSSGEKGDG